MLQKKNFLHMFSDILLSKKELFGSGVVITQHDPHRIRLDGTCVFGSNVTISNVKPTIVSGTGTHSGGGWVQGHGSTGSSTVIRGNGNTVVSSTTVNGVTRTTVNGQLVSTTDGGGGVVVHNGVVQNGKVCTTGGSGGRSRLVSALLAFCCGSSSGRGEEVNVRAAGVGVAAPRSSTRGIVPRELVISDASFGDGSSIVGNDVRIYNTHVKRAEVNVQGAGKLDVSGHRTSGDDANAAQEGCVSFTVGGSAVVSLVKCLFPRNWARVRAFGASRVQLNGCIVGGGATIESSGTAHVEALNASSILGGEINASGASRIGVRKTEITGARIGASGTARVEMERCWLRKRSEVRADGASRIGLFNTSCDASTVHTSGTSKITVRKCALNSAGRMMASGCAQMSASASDIFARMSASGCGTFEADGAILTRNHRVAGVSTVRIGSHGEY
jgi:hypothetical protein